ncbi:MAG TPA: trigger factor [Holophagaceae bacterium]|nr:trigger factor [Holophagaceae bacterium]
MTATLTQNSPTRMSLEITVPAKEVSAAFDAVVSKIAPKVRIPGFRPGKAPKSVLIQKFAREIHQEVAESLVKGHFWSQAEQSGVQPISNPALEKLDLKDGADATFRAAFDVAPAVSLPEYKALKVAKRKRKIDDEALSEQLEGLRQRATRFMPVEDGAVEAGLIVTLDIKAKLQGQKSQMYRDQVIEIDAARPFDTALLGLKADESRSFDVEHGDDAPALKGKKVHYEATIKDLRKRSVPELGDEMAKDLGFDDLKAMKAAIRKDLDEAAERDAVARLQTTILDTLLDAAPFEVPRSLVIMQLDDYCQEFAQAAARQGIDAKRINWNAYRQHRLNDAERAVRSGYLLQTIGNAEDIQVAEEEIDADIRAYMEEHKVQTPFNVFKADLEQRNTTTEIKGRIRTDKIFAKLLETAKVTEEILDKAAFMELLEMERRREAGQAVGRFDAGGLEGGGFEEQEGGEPAAVTAAEHEHVHGPDCDHDHEHEAKPKKAAKKAAPKAEEKAAEKTEDKPKKKAAKK